MSHWGILSQWKKICYLIIILALCMGFTGLNEVAKGFTFIQNKGLNPIPNSPPPPRDFKLCSTRTYTSGYNSYNELIAGQQFVSPHNPNIWEGSVPAKINEYAVSKNYTLINNNITSINEGFSVNSNQQALSYTNSMLMYPQVRDIIPPVASITNAILITSNWGSSSLALEVYEITSSWDPRSFSGNLPSFSSSSIGTGTFDIASTTITNRTIDVTSTVQNWFNNTNPQWGFMVKASVDGSIQTTYPPRLYISYVMPEGSFQTGQISGGTWYEDSVCPGMWIPRRATYISKYGILGDNVVTTGVLAGSMTYKPPFGYDNQSMRWVVPGKTFNQQIAGQSWQFDINAQSYQTLQKCLNQMPPINTLPFMRQPPPNDTWPPPPVRPQPVYDDHGAVEPFPPTWPDGDRPVLGFGPVKICIPIEDDGSDSDEDKDGDGLPDNRDYDSDGDGIPDRTKPVLRDQNGNEAPIIPLPPGWKPGDPIPGYPPKDETDPGGDGNGGGGDELPIDPEPVVGNGTLGRNWPLPPDGTTSTCSLPLVRHANPGLSKTYTSQNQTSQWLTFKNSQINNGLSAINPNSTGWFSNFGLVSNSAQVRPNGNMNSSIGYGSTSYCLIPPVDDLIGGDPPFPVPGTGGTDPEPGPNPNPDPPEPPPDNPPSTGTEPGPSDKKSTHNFEFVIWIGPKPILQTPAPDINPEVLDDDCEDNQSLEAYDTGLPYPEFAQSENVGTGNSESPIQKEISITKNILPNLLSGAAEHTKTDFSIPCHGGLNMEFSRTYCSNFSAATRILGYGWSTNIEESVSYASDGYVSYKSSSGEVYLFTPNRNSSGVITSYASPPQLKANVEILGSGDNSNVRITTSDGLLSKTFDRYGRISSITTAIGGHLDFVRNQSNAVIELKDVYSNRKLSFTYDAYGRLTSVEAPESRNWTYQYNANGDLAVATNPIGGTWNYTYNTNHKMTKFTNPKGNETRLTLDSSNKLIEISSGATTTDKTVISYDESHRGTNIQTPSGSDMTTLFSVLGQTSAIVDDNGRWVQFDYDSEFIMEILRVYNQGGNVVNSNIYDSKGRCAKQYDGEGYYREYTYTQGGKISSVKDREGNTTTLLWNNDESMVVKIIDSLGRSTDFSYDNNKNLIAIVNPYKEYNPAANQFEYDSNGYVNKVINALNKNTQFAYNNCGEMVSTTNALGKTTELTYNKMGWMTKVKGPSPDNYEINYTYDANGNLTSVKNSRNYTTSYEYNDKDLLTKTVNSLNQNTYYEYDTSGKLTKVKDHNLNNVSLTYDNTGRIRKLTDQDGKVTQYIYNIIGEVSGYLNNQSERNETIEYDSLYRTTKVTTAEGSITQYEYDKEGHVKKVTDPLGRISTFDYDACYQVTKVTDNMNNYSTMEYWPSGQIKKTTDPLGHIAQFDYNKLGAVVSTKDNQNHETTFEYNDMGWPTKTTDALGNYVTTEYSIYGQPTKSTNQLGKYSTFEYDANGNCKKSTSSLGKVTEWVYDELDRVKQTITPMGYVYESKYDEVGNLIEQKDPLAHLEKYEYNTDYTLKKYIDQINNETAYDYNDNNAVTKVTTPKGTYQQYTYDKDGQLTSVTDPIGNVTSYNYDLAGQLIGRVMPKVGGGTSSYSYAYDGLGRRTGFADEAGQATTVAYNPIGLTTQVSHPNNKTISSTYDDLNRLTGITFGGGESFSFGYDALSRNTTATDAIGTKTVTYDAASRVTAVEDPFGDDTTFAYDDDNRTTSMTTPRGTTSFTYDNDSRPTSTTLPNNDVITSTFDNAARLTHSDLPNTVDLDFTYNNANMLTQKAYSIPSPMLANPNPYPYKPNSKISNNRKMSMFEEIGRFVQYTMPKNIDKMTLEEFTRLSVQNYIRNKDKIFSPGLSFTTPIATFSYDYDANRNITGRVYPAGSTTYTFDNYDRLTEADAPEGVYTYTYDVRNNRATMTFVNTDNTVNQTTTYTYTVDDRLSSYVVLNNLNNTVIRTAEYTYDNAGNTLTKAVTEGGITLTTTYTYYDDNRIKTVTLPNNDLITYTYHADGSRATKTNATEYITYHYASGLVKEVHHDKNNLNTIFFTVHYEPSRMIISSGGTETVYYTVTDTQGTVYKLLNSAGTVVASYNYDPFGYRIENTNPTIYMPLGFAATYYDSETGLNFAQQRYYDSVTGRFTTKDSYRGDAGSPISQNRYIYCHQNPISFADPSGFKPMEGEHASDSTPTEQKTEHKTDVKPPESKPSMVIPEKDKYGNAPGQASQDPKNKNLYHVNIGGYTIDVTYDPATKTIKCEAADTDFNKQNKFDADGIAKGLQDGFNALPETLRIGIFTDFTNFINTISNFFEKNKSDFEKMYGAKRYQLFMFCAVVGYGVAKQICGETNLDEAIQDLLKYDKNGGNAFDVIMKIGFFCAFHNSSYNSALEKWTLDFSWDSSGNSLNSYVGFKDLVKFATLEYAIITGTGYLAAGLIDGKKLGEFYGKLHEEFAKLQGSAEKTASGSGKDKIDAFIGLIQSLARVDEAWKSLFKNWDIINEYTPDGKKINPIEECSWKALSSFKSIGILTHIYMSFVRESMATTKSDFKRDSIFQYEFIDMLNASVWCCTFYDPRNLRPQARMNQIKTMIEYFGFDYSSYLSLYSIMFDENVEERKPKP